MYVRFNYYPAERLSLIRALVHWEDKNWFTYCTHSYLSSLPVLLWLENTLTVGCRQLLAISLVWSIKYEKSSRIRVIRETQVFADLLVGGGREGGARVKGSKPCTPPPPPGLPLF